MATVNKDFKVKHGLVVEGATATVNGNQVLTETDSDQYIIDLIGGETLITSVNNADFEVNGGELTIATGSDLVRTTDINEAIDNLTTADIEEGVTNLYYTDARVESVIDNSLAINGAIKNAIDSAVPDNTDGLSEGVNNLYFTDTRAVSAVTGLNNSDYYPLAEKDGKAGVYKETVASTLAGGNGLVVTPTNLQSLSVDTNVIATTSYADQAEADAKTYADGLASNYDPAGSASQALTDAQNYADAQVQDSQITSTTTWSSYKTSTEIGLAQQAAEDHADQAVADLVNGAPELLDTLNELAAALQDNPDVISDLQGIAAGKQDQLTAGNGIDIDGSSNISVDIFDFINNTDPGYIPVGQKSGNLGINKDTLKDYTDTLYDAIGSAAQALSDAEDYTDTAVSTKADSANPTITGDLTVDGTGDFTIDADAGIILQAGTASYLNSATSGNEIATEGYVDTAIAGVTIDPSGWAGNNLDWNGQQFDVNAADVAAELTTDDIAEGLTNQYFTNERAKTSAAEALTNAQLTNITITGGGTLIDPLVITAENGVADSDTDDLTEGTTNLYFTDQRAIDALQDTTPNFTEVDINSLAKQIAATVSAPTGGSQVTAYSFNSSDYRSAEFLVKTVSGDHSEISKVLLTLDINNNISITEYGTIGTNGSLMTVTADTQAGAITPFVRLRVTTTNNNSTVTVMGTLLV
jgi:hypothetical protein